jgi:hypothetical protein
VLRRVSATVVSLLSCSEIPGRLAAGLVFLDQVPPLMALRRLLLVVGSALWSAPAPAAPSPPPRE